MVEIIWTNQALLDLEGIGDYIAKDSPVYASITVDKLFHKPNLLKGNPRIGRIIPEKNDEDIREQIEGNYRIIHQIISKEKIVILTVIHSARILNI